MTGEDLKRLSTLEKRLASILSEKPGMAAVDLAKLLYPYEPNIRSKVSLISVVLRRMEKKGAVLEAGKDGKKVLFNLSDDVKQVIKQPEQGPRQQISPSEALLKEVDVKKTEKVEVSVEHAPGEEPKLKETKTTETTYEVKLTQKEEKIIEPAGQKPLKSERDTNIIRLLGELKEAAASDLAQRMFEQPDKGKTALVSVYLSRLEAKGLVARTQKIGRKAFFSLAIKPKPEEKPEDALVRLGEHLGVEGKVLEKLKELKESSASDLAKAIFPAEEYGKNRTAQLYVTLKRLEQKNLIVETRREGRKVYFAFPSEAAKTPLFSDFPKLPGLPKLPKLELPSMPHIPPMYSAVGLSVVVVALIFYNFGGGMGFFTLPGKILSLSLDQQQTGDQQNFLYGVKNINTHPVTEVKVEAILPPGSVLDDSGGAQMSKSGDSIILTWLLDSIQPNEKQTFSFAGKVPGHIQLLATGLSEQEEQQNIPADRPAQAILPAGEYGYKQLSIQPVGYLSEISVILSAGPEGTNFTDETVLVKDIPIVSITQNVTTVIVNETPAGPVCGNNIVEAGEQCDTSDLAGKDCTSIGQNFVGGMLGCNNDCTLNTASCTLPPVEQPPIENVTPPAPPVNPPVIPPVQPQQPVENVTPSAPTPSTPPSAENVTPAAPEQNATPLPTPTPQQPIALPPTAGIVMPPTAGIVTPPPAEEQPAPQPEQPAPEPEPQQEPVTTMKIYLDPDTEFNGNEDLIGEQPLYASWDGTLKVQLPAKKYAEKMNLVFYSDKGAVVLVKSLGLKWTVEVSVNASESFLSQFYENVTNETEKEIGIGLHDSKNKLVNGEITVLDKNGKEIKKEKEKFKVKPEKYKVRIRPNSSIITEIVLDDVNLSTDLALGIDDVPDSIQRPQNVIEWKQMYAIDSSGTDFTSGRLTATAKGNALFKCRDWNFAAQNCTGSWEKVMYLTPGSEYTVPLSPGDPGYGEANITIINVQSYPTVGGNWSVYFNTTGMADLKITAVNGTVWTNHSDGGYDLKFLEIKCGQQKMNYTWVGGNCNQTGNCSVLITNYTCPVNGTEVSKVLTEGSHYLEFDFGGDIKHAKNYAVYQTVKTVSGTETWCGSVNGYDKIVVLNGGKIQICPYNGTAGSGWVNITFTGAGNFTVEAGGIVNGTDRGGRGGAGTTGTPGNATQGENGNNWTATAAAVAPNGGGGGGAARSTSFGGAGGGGGAFGGNGGNGGVTTDAVANKGSNGISYGSASATYLKSGSGGGGGAGDSARRGGNGGAGFKVDAGAGTIIIDGTVNMNGTVGEPDAGDTDTGVGGGGSGGHIILRAYNLDVSGAVIHAAGGYGGRTTNIGTDDCGGGGGGGGRIVYEYGTFSNTSTSSMVLGGLVKSTSCVVAPIVGDAGSVYYSTGSFGSTAVYSVSMTAPSSDPNNFPSSTFLMNCTPQTGGVPVGVNLSYDFNDTSYWRAMPLSGSTDLTVSANPEYNVTNNTLYISTVTMQSAGTYNVRCRLYNSTYSVNSSSQTVTVKAPSINSVTLQAPSSDPNPYQDTNFTMICSATTNAASTGINISFEYNTSTAAWTEIPDTGTTNLTIDDNIDVNIANNTNYTSSIDPLTVGTFNIRCRAYNSSYSMNSSSIQVTVLPHTYVLNLTDPVQGNPVQVTDGTNITVNFTFTRDDVAINTSVSMINVTIGGLNATILPGSGGGGASGLGTVEETTVLNLINDTLDGYTNNHIYPLGATIGDVDNDGTNEIVAVGQWINNGTDNGWQNASCAMVIYNLTGTKLVAEDYEFWQITDGKECRLWDVDYGDLDGDSKNEIVAVGGSDTRVTTYGQTNYTAMIIARWNSGTMTTLYKGKWQDVNYPADATEGRGVKVTTLTNGHSGKQIVMTSMSENNALSAATIDILNCTPDCTAPQFVQHGSWYMFYSTTSATTSTDLDVADIDGDSNTEIMIAGDYGAISGFLSVLTCNNTYGCDLTNSSARTYSMPGTSPDRTLKRVTAGDVDYDGRIEIVASGLENAGTNVLRILNWNASSGFTSKVNITYAETTCNEFSYNYANAKADAVAVANIDDDAYKEIIWGGGCHPSTGNTDINNVLNITQYNGTSVKQANLRWQAYGVSSSAPSDYLVGELDGNSSTIEIVGIGIRSNTTLVWSFGRTSQNWIRIWSQPYTNFDSTGGANPWYSQGYWHVNVTVPNGLSGLQNLTVIANSTTYANVSTDTETAAIQYKSQAVTSVTMDAPATDLSNYVADTFTMSCTPQTGGASTGTSISLEFNTSAFGWTAIPTSGSANLTSTINPQANVLTGTQYDATITAKSADTYNVRCRLYNSTNSVYSGSKQIAVSPHVYTVNITVPTTAVPVQVNDSSNITVKFYAQRDGVNVTSAVEIINVTIGGLNCTLLPGGGGGGASGLGTPQTTENTTILVPLANYNDPYNSSFVNYFGGTAVDDVDGDGTNEILAAGAWISTGVASDWNNTRCFLRIFNYTNGQLQVEGTADWQIVPGWLCRAYAIEIGDVDNNPANKEIVLTGSHYHNGGTNGQAKNNSMIIARWNGSSITTLYKGSWQNDLKGTAALAGGGMALEIATLTNGQNRPNIIVGTPAMSAWAGHIALFNCTADCGTVTQVQDYPLKMLGDNATTISDFAVGNFDGDANTEIAAVGDTGSPSAPWFDMWDCTDAYGCNITDDNTDMLYTRPALSSTVFRHLVAGDADHDGSIEFAMSGIAPTVLTFVTDIIKWNGTAMARVATFNYTSGGNCNKFSMLSWVDHTAVAMGNIDDDAYLEIISGTGCSVAGAAGDVYDRQFVYQWNGTVLLQQNYTGWQESGVSTAPFGLEIADIDGNTSTMEIIDSGMKANSAGVDPVTFGATTSGFLRIWSQPYTNFEGTSGGANPWYADGSWYVNCTVPAGLSGLQTLVVNGNATDYSDGITSGTQTNSVEYPGAAGVTTIAYSNVGSNTTTPAAWSGVKLYANWSTNATSLGYAFLSTNETGTWQNKTATYGYIDIDKATLTWSNFTWQNDSMDGNTIVGWRIYANNSDGRQNVTDINTFTVGSTVLITLTRNTVSFGSMSSGVSNDTSDNSPLPFEISNDGNVKVNITINATNLFNASANPSSAFRAAANTSSEGITYTSSCTNITWFNMPAAASPALFMCFLDWFDTRDVAETEIYLSVPITESTGAKSSTVTFIGTMA